MRRKYYLSLHETVNKDTELEVLLIKKKQKIKNTFSRPSLVLMQKLILVKQSKRNYANWIPRTPLQLVKEVTKKGKDNIGERLTMNQMMWNFELVDTIQRLHKY